MDIPKEIYEKSANAIGYKPVDHRHPNVRMATESEWNWAEAP